MELYVLQCFSGKEDLVRKKLSRNREELESRLHIPRRILRNRKGGLTRQKEYILFPGYIFMAADEIDSDFYQFMRKIPELIRVLPENSSPRPLAPQEHALLLSLLRGGEQIGSSRVRFDENNRIEVLSGPMEGLEGRILRVDRRKGRARVRLDIYEKTFEVDFPFSDINKIEGEGSARRGHGDPAADRRHETSREQGI